MNDNSKVCASKKNRGGRIAYLEYLRVLATFSVIILHVASENFYDVNVASKTFLLFSSTNSCVRFVVPVFVMISGVFFLNPNSKKSIKQLFKNNILRMIIVFVCWSTFYTLWMYNYNGNHLSQTQWTNNLFKGHYHMWYLWLIIGLYLATPVLKKITADKQVTEYYLIVTLIIGFIYPFIKHYLPFGSEIFSYIDTKGEFQLFKGFMFYFVAGYYFHNLDLKKLIRYIIYIMGIGSTVYMIYVTRAASIANGEAVVYYYSSTLPLVLFQSIAVFNVFKYSFRDCTLNNKFGKVIEYLSKISFGIYLIHPFFLEFYRVKFNFTTLTYNPLLSFALVFLVVSLSSIVISTILNKIPVLNKYIV